MFNTFSLELYNVILFTERTSKFEKTVSLTNVEIVTKSSSTY